MEQTELETLWDDICAALPDDVIRTFFEKHKKVLQSAYAGKKMPKFADLHPKDLRDALRTQRKNQDARTFLEATLQTWLKEYETACAQAKAAGCTQQLATVKGILASPFRTHPDVIFQLDKASNRSKAARQAVIDFVEEITRPSAAECKLDELKAREKKLEQAERALQKETHDQKEQLKKEAERLSKEQAAKSAAFQEEERTQQEKSAAARKELAELQQKLAAVKDEADAWQAAQTTQEDAMPELYDLYAGTADGGIFSIMASDHTREHVLRRIADVDRETGDVSLFSTDSIERWFEHSKTIWSTKIVLPEGYCTLVNWQPQPNRNAPEKTFYVSEECKTASYIEVVLLPDCQSLADVAKKLREGIRLVDSHCRWALTYPSASERQEAILLMKKDFVQRGDVWTLSPDCAEAPVFVLEQSYILPFAGGKRWLYQKLSLGTSVHTLFLKSKNEIIRECVLEAASRKRLASLGIKTADWHVLRQALQDALTEDLYTQVARACRWPREEAQRAVRLFLESVDAQVLCQDIDTEALCLLARRNPDIIAECKEALSEDWRAEHTAERKAAEAKLGTLRKEAEQVADDLEKQRRAHDGLAKDYEKMKSELAQRKQIVQDVEQNVRKELAELRQHTAEAVARAMVAYPLMGGAGTLASGERAEFIEQPVFLQPLEESAADQEELLSVLQGNLDEVGVKEERVSRAFAALSYACALRGLPLFFAGTSAVGLADALACGLYGEMPLLVDLPRTYSPALMQELEARPGRAMILENVFASEWIDHIDRLTNLGAKQLFFVAPFADDLALLPKGIVSYGLPILTDLLLDIAEPDGWTFSGSKKQDLFLKDVVTGATYPVRSPYVRALGMMVFEETRYEDILALAHGLSGAKETDVMDALLCGVPYAYLHDTLATYWRGLKSQKLWHGEDTTEIARVTAMFGAEVLSHA